ncbi:MAG: hypothetical protein K9G62_07315 [Alphaproteobacteria bacterium]|nr:hypothetical protein [Alphaproteobacteria bacterium]
MLAAFKKASDGVAKVMTFDGWLFPAFIFWSASLVDPSAGIVAMCKGFYAAVFNDPGSVVDGAGNILEWAVDTVLPGSGPS